MSIASFLAMHAPFDDWAAIAWMADEEIPDPATDGETVEAEDLEAWALNHPCISGNVAGALDEIYEEFGGEYTWEYWCIGEFYHALRDHGVRFLCSGCGANLDSFEEAIYRFCKPCRCILKHKTPILRELRSVGLKERDILKQPKAKVSFLDPAYGREWVSIAEIEKHTGISSVFLKLRRRNKDGHEVPAYHQNKGWYRVADIKRYLMSTAADRHKLPEKALLIRLRMATEEVVAVQRFIDDFRRDINDRNREGNGRYAGNSESHVEPLGQHAKG